MDAAFLNFHAIFDHLRYGFRFEIIVIGHCSEIGVNAAGIYIANADILGFYFLGENLADALHSVLGGAVASGHRTVKKTAAA